MVYLQEGIWLYWVKKKSIFISRMLLLDTDLAVTSSLSKRGRLLTSPWGAMGTILLRRALLSGPPSSAWDREMSKIVHSVTKTELKWWKKKFETSFLAFVCQATGC
jgi:hypothetical protein